MARPARSPSAVVACVHLPHRHHDGYMDEPPDVVTPTVGVDPRVALATTMHAAPGVFAVLAGSGLSSSARIPTGWQIVQDLVRRVATAEGVPASELGADPVTWWGAQRRPELRYDTLLGEIATTDAARQLLLRGYFEPAPGELPQPTTAHAALAGLVARGSVRVILTTNFDRLIERALGIVGVAAQVISAAEHIEGMVPLAHAPVTLVKLHGDYTTLGLRNTRVELATYPPALAELLHRVAHEYGLLIAGWSGDWDVALADALRSAPNRRYPRYWVAHHGRLTETGRTVCHAIGAHGIAAADADEFFADLVERLGRLDAVAARRGRPQLVSTPAFLPESRVAPQGWAALPLLQMRIVASFGPTTESDEFIRPTQRGRLIQALNASAFSARLRHSAGLLTPASALTEESPLDVAPLEDWAHAPDAHQSLNQATFRLGGDAAAGVSALVTIRPPSFARGGQILFIADVGLSLAFPLPLTEAALIARDGLVLTTAELPAALNDVLPPEADVQQAEVHFLAATVDGHTANRPNDLLNRLDLSAFGPPTRQIGEQVGFAARLASPLTQRDAAELTVSGLDYLALNYGWLDPSHAVAALSDALQLPAADGPDP